MALQVHLMCFAFCVWPAAQTLPWGAASGAGGTCSWETDFGHSSVCLDKGTSSSLFLFSMQFWTCSCCLTVITWLIQPHKSDSGGPEILRPANSHWLWLSCTSSAFHRIRFGLVLIYWKLPIYKLSTFQYFAFLYCSRTFNRCHFFFIAVW